MRHFDFCSGGRIRTYNHLLNREPHYHCATPEYSYKNNNNKARCKVLGPVILVT